MTGNDASEKSQEVAKAQADSTTSESGGSEKTEQRRRWIDTTKPGRGTGITLGKREK
mgnify:CR=1 FL=1